MSLDSTRWAWDQTLPPSTKLVLLALAQCVNSRGPGSCYPGQDRLAAMCGLKVRQLRNVLDDLTARGLIEIDHRGRAGGGRRTNSYRLAPMQQTPDPRGGKPAIFNTSNRQPSADLGGQTGNPVPVLGGQSGNPVPVLGGGKPAMNGGQTGNPVPITTKDEREEKRGKEKREAKLRVVEHQPDPAAPVPLSLATGLDWQGILASLRPDIRDPAGVWHKFEIYHQGQDRDAGQWEQLWRLWVSRERENSTERSVIAGRDRPLGAFLDNHRQDDLTAAFEVTHGP